MSGTLHGALSVLIAVIQLAFPMLGQHTYQGQMNVTLDGIPYACNVSADTAADTLTAELTAMGLSVFSMQGDKNGASASGILGNEALDATELLTALVGAESGLQETAPSWEKLSDYLNRGEWMDDLSVIASWLSTFSSLPPAYVYEDDALCFRYTLTSSEILRLPDLLWQEATKKSLEAEQLKTMKLWDVIGLDAETSIHQGLYSLCIWLLRDSFGLRDALMRDPLLEDYQITVTLVTDAREGEFHYHDAQISSARLDIISHVSGSETVWKATLDSSGLSGIVTYEGVQSASFFAGPLGGVFTVNVKAAMPYGGETYALNLTLGDDASPLRLTLNAVNWWYGSRKLAELVYDKQQVRFYLSVDSLVVNGYAYVKDNRILSLNAEIDDELYMRTALADLTPLSDGLEVSWSVQTQNRQTLNDTAEDTGTLAYHVSNAPDGFTDSMTLQWSAYGMSHLLSETGEHHWQ